jgi:3-oxoadipate enol-lactonase
MADIALLHAGIADSRMWAPQLESFGREHRVIAPDLPGFGTTPIESDVVDNRAFVRAALDEAGMERAVLVGTSFGGRVALELTLESPERVSALVLVGAPIDGQEWSPEVQRFAEEEEAAFARGDFDAAVEPNLHLWVAGPRRTLDDVDPAVTELVRDMQRNIYVLQDGHDDLQVVPLDPPASQRLGEVMVPTLVLTGDEDVADIHATAARLATEIPHAERATIAQAAHLPNLERPDEFDRVVLGFLAEHGV